MDKELVNFLSRLDLRKDEIQNIANISPQINDISCRQFVVNCELLTTYGYPETELDTLILANPNIFVKISLDLEQELINLSQICGDVETALKKDPYLI